MAKCKSCSGQGYVKCPKCGGKGEIWKSDVFDKLDPSNVASGKWKECSLCSGSGRKECGACRGTGETWGLCCPILSEVRLVDECSDINTMSKM
jgi:hypothetical protein